MLLLYLRRGLFIKEGGVLYIKEGWVVFNVTSMLQRGFGIKEGGVPLYCYLYVT